MRISVDGIQRQVKRFQNIKRRVQSFRMFFEQVAKPLLIEEVEAIFQREGIAPRWRPLALSTLIEKREAGLDNGILRRTGRLYRAYTDGSGARVSDTRFSYTVDVPYARFHEFGTSRIPQRQVFGQVIRNKTYQRNLVTAARAYIRRGVSEAGR